MAGTPTWWDGFVRDVCKRWERCHADDFVGLPAVLVNGNPFVALYGYDILVRLDEFSRNRALAKSMARELAPEDGVKFPRGWVLLTVPSSAAERFSEEWSRPAYEYVRALPPKRRPPEPAAEKKGSRRSSARVAKPRPAKRK
jgi:hypothetical protein